MLDVDYMLLAMCRCKHVRKMRINIPRIVDRGVGPIVDEGVTVKEWQV